MKRSILLAILVALVLMPVIEASAQEATVDDKALLELREAMQRLNAGNVATTNAVAPDAAGSQPDSREEALQRLREALANLDQPTPQVVSNTASSGVPVIDPETIRRLQESMKTNAPATLIAPQVAIPEPAPAAPLVVKTAEPEPINTLPVPVPRVVTPEVSRIDEEFDQQFRRNAANEAGRSDTGVSDATIRHNEQYKPAFGDKLSYLVLEDPDHAMGPIEVPVRVQNTIVFPVSMNTTDYPTDTVAIDIEKPDGTRKTVAEIQRELKEDLEREYYHKATLRLRVEDLSTVRGKVIFTGFGAGVVDLEPGVVMTLSAAITRINLQIQWADTKRIEIRRKNAQTGVMEKTVHDLSKIERDPRLDPVLQDGDYVAIREKTFIFN